jgi:hypothetical protein
MTDHLLERLLANNSSSLETPDFRFVNYCYPSQGLNCPHLPQNLPGWNGAPALGEQALAAFRRLG